MRLKELILQSWDALARNRLRSILTMMGIVWGLTTVVLLLGYGESVSDGVLTAFLGIGNNVIMIWQGQTSMQAGGQRAGKRIHFKYEDLQAIRDEAPLVRLLSGEWDDGLAYKYGDKIITVSSKAVQYPYGEMRKLNIAEGRYFEESDFAEHRHVLIFGPSAAKKVFGNRDPVGEHVTINGETWDVIGLLKLKIQDSSNNGPDNENVFLPFESLSDINDQRDPEMIAFQPVAALQHKAALGQVREVLARRHNFNPKDDKSSPEWDTVEDTKEIEQFGIALRLILGFIGVLTLGVGGVGVMNIMLVSVTERTKEVGLRKALGARNRDIAFQFLVEALVLTFAAGLAGMLVSVLLAHAIPPMPLYSDMYKTANHEGDIILKTSGGVMLTAFVILAFVGVTAGMWPALKASRMEPVEALRYE
ncbi:MAG: ABC transporter permease [Candidatus Sulfotelmatobacter sp.]|jgi:putative ABC transport system permease protein